MNKSQIIENVAREVTISKAAAERAVNAFLEEVKRGIRKDKVVQLVGFGTFKLKNRKARIGRNPRTGQAVRLKPSRTVGFKAGIPFKATI